VVGNDIGGRPKGVWPEKSRKFHKWVKSIITGLKNNKTIVQTFSSFSPDFRANPRAIVFVFSTIEVATVTFDREPVFLPMILQFTLDAP
jgi:hypothetical protein